jgi:hypothetical protein
MQCLLDALMLVVHSSRVQDPSGPYLAYRPAHTWVEKVKVLISANFRRPLFSALAFVVYVCLKLSRPPPKRFGSYLLTPASEENSDASHYRQYIEDRS